MVGYIPLFNSAPHAYSYFHISGVHYFTISCILIPALTVLYTKVTEKNFGQDMDTFNCRKPDGSGDSYFMCLQISAVVCGWLCGSDVSDVV